MQIQRKFTLSLKQKIQKKLKYYVTSLEQHADRNWYPTFIGFLAALDNILLVIPNDGILIGSCLLIPKRWPIFSIFIALGSTLGALALSCLVKSKGLPWILDIYPDLNQGEIWLWSEKFFADYGLLLVFAFALSPLMQQPIVIIAALANTSDTELGVVIFGGRLIKYILLGFLASHSPILLKKLWGLKNEMRDAGVTIEEKNSSIQK